MKYLILIAVFFPFSCNNKSQQAKIYEDSAAYYSNQLAALTDSGFSSNDSIRMRQEARIVIYNTMRQHYIDLAKESK